MAQPKRYSQWQETLPFSLNDDFYGPSAETQNFTTPITEAVPILSEFSTIGPDPSGWRHLIFHPSFIKTLASGAGYASINFDPLDFNATDISTGSGVSKTKVILFRISEITSPGKTMINKIKFWASDLSDFITKETSKILYRPSTPWLSGFAFTKQDFANKDYWLSDTLPDAQNLFRTGGFRTIHGSGDMDVSEWMYICLAASGTTPLGEYGSIINGQPSGFQIRVTYNLQNRPELFD